MRRAVGLLSVAADAYGALSGAGLQVASVAALPAVIAATLDVCLVGAAGLLLGYA